jgi:hypothetical protein
LKGETRKVGVAQLVSAPLTLRVRENSFGIDLAFELLAEGFPGSCR